MSAAIRRIRSESADRPRAYDVDERTSLERHRRLSARDRAHSATRRRLEAVVRDLLERQRRLSAELERQRREQQRLRAEAERREQIAERAARGEESAAARAGRAEHAAAEAQEELEEALGKLAKADHYIRVLSDEAAEREVEAQELRTKLEEERALRRAREEAERQPSPQQHKEENGEKKEEEHHQGGEREDKEEQRVHAEDSGDALARVVELVLSCADGCDTASRECEELIDVIREEQKQQQQELEQRQEGQSGFDGGYPLDELIQSHAWAAKSAPAFVSCKPSEAELARLFAMTRGPLPVPGARHTATTNNNNNSHNNNSAAYNPDRIVALEAIASRLLHGMSTALGAFRDDVLVSSRAYAELSRANRDHCARAESLRATAAETRASLARVIDRNETLSSELSAATSTRDALRAALDDAEVVMAEAATLAEERTARTDALLRDNAALETSVAAYRRTVRERDEQLAAASRDSRDAHEKTAQLTQSVARLESALREAQRAAARAAEERDAKATELRNAAELRKAEAEAAQRHSVDCVFAQKRAEDLQAQLEQAQRERHVLREARDAAERERRQALVQLDAARRGADAAANVSESPKPSDTRRTSPTAAGEKSDKVRWWGERLEALAAQARQDDMRVARSLENRFAEDWSGRIERQSAALAALAYGPPANSGEDSA